MNLISQLKYFNENKKKKIDLVIKIVYNSVKVD